MEAQTATVFPKLKLRNPCCASHLSMPTFSLLLLQSPMSGYQHSRQYSNRRVPKKRPAQPPGDGPLKAGLLPSHRDGSVLQQPGRRLWTGEAAPPDAGCCWPLGSALALLSRWSCCPARTHAL